MMTESKKMRLGDLRSLLNEMLDDGSISNVFVEHAPGGMYGCCNEPSEWTFTVYHDDALLDIVRWSGGHYTSEMGFINATLRD